MSSSTLPSSISMKELREYLSNSESVLTELTRNIGDLVTGELIKRGILVATEINISYDVASKDTAHPKISIYAQPFYVSPSLFRSVELQATSSFEKTEEEKVFFEVNLDCLCTMYSRGYHLIPLFSLSGTIDKQGKVKEPKIDLRY